MNYYQPYSYYPQQTMPSIIYVTGEDEAKMYPVAPNNTVQLWDTNGKAVYLKQADVSGKPSLRIYDITERVSEPEPTASYVTKNELEELRAEIEKLKVRRKRNEPDEFNGYVTAVKSKSYADVNAAPDEYPAKHSK